LVGELSKLAPFSGLQADFKLFEQALWRVAAVNDLEFTLDALYSTSEHFDFRDNKILYYLLEQAVSGSVVAYSHFKKAPKYDGNRAYFALREAYVFSGQANGAILLQSLANFRLKGGELVSSFCLRLQELFESLETLEGDNAFVFNNTQRLGYLLTAIRNEPSLEMAYAYIQSEMNRGTTTFDLAVTDLLLRCETARADEALDTAEPASRRRGLAARSRDTEDNVALDPDELAWLSADQRTEIRAMVTTMNKRHHSESSSSSAGTGQTNANTGTVCLVEGCTELCSMPMCRLHFAAMVCGKTPQHTLRDGMGIATSVKATNSAQYPDTVPEALQRLIPRTSGKGSDGKGNGASRGRGAGGRRDR
jgi:hypothetical protein